MELTRTKQTQNTSEKRALPCETRRWGGAPFGYVLSGPPADAADPVWADVGAGWFERVIGPSDESEYLYVRKFLNWSKRVPKTTNIEPEGKQKGVKVSQKEPSKTPPAEQGRNNNMKKGLTRRCFWEPFCSKMDWKTPPQIIKQTITNEHGIVC